MKNVAAVVDKYTKDMVAEMIVILRNSGSRNLLNKINTELLSDVEYIESRIKMPSYGYYASEGRAAGRFPPLDAIEQWADERNIDQAAVYPIALKIASLGTQADANHFLNAFKLTPEFEKAVLDGFLQDVKDAIINAASQIDDLETQ